MRPVPAPYCSGGAKPGVSRRAPVDVVPSTPSNSLAMPKSTSTAAPSGVILILAGLISRWTMLR